MPPSFLAPFNYSGFDQLAVDYFGVPHHTHFWVAVDGFQYWTDITTGNDVQFVDGGQILWNFAPLNVVDQPDNLFTVPTNTPNCQGEPIDFSKILDPFFRLALVHQ